MLPAGHRLLRRPHLKVFEEDGWRSVRIDVRTGRYGGAIVPEVPVLNFFQISDQDRLPVTIEMHQRVSGTGLCRFVDRVLDGPYSNSGKPTPGPTLRDLLTTRQISLLFDAVGRGLAALEAKTPRRPPRGRRPRRDRRR